MFTHSQLLAADGWEMTTQHSTGNGNVHFGWPQPQQATVEYRRSECIDPNSTAADSSDSWHTTTQSSVSAATGKVANMTR